MFRIRDRRLMRELGKAGVIRDKTLRDIYKSKGLEYKPDKDNFLKFDLGKGILYLFDRLYGMVIPFATGEDFDRAVKITERYLSRTRGEEVRLELEEEK